VPEGADMLRLGPEDERRVWDSPGERRHGGERPRPAWDEPESGARRGRSGGGGGGRRRPRRHIPSRGRCSPLSLSTDAMRCELAATRRAYGRFIGEGQVESKSWASSSPPKISSSTIYVHSLTLLAYFSWKLMTHFALKSLWSIFTMDIFGFSTASQFVFTPFFYRFFLSPFVRMLGIVGFFICFFPLWFFFRGRLRSGSMYLDGCLHYPPLALNI
jgi:hypothetical protein